MQEDVLKWFNDYSTKSKLFDEVAIEELAYNMINENGLEEYIANVKFADILQNVDRRIDVATYSPLSKKLIINQARCLDMLNQLKIHEVYFNELERNYFRNVMIFQIILHEIEHAIQNKKMLEEDTEARILYLSNIEKAGEHLYVLYNGHSICDISDPIKALTIAIPYFQKVRSVYNEYYDYCPQERMAQIRSYLKTIDILEPLKDKFPNLLEFIGASQLDSFIRGYEVQNMLSTSPTIYYLKKLKYYDELKDFDWYDEDYNECLRKSLENYSLADRMTLGLPITEREKDGIVKLLIKTNKYNAVESI